MTDHPLRYAQGDKDAQGQGDKDAQGQGDKVPGARALLSGFVGFAGATLALTAIAGWALTLGFRGPGDSSAIAVSAAIAIVVQLASFPVVRGLAARNLTLGWGAGAVIRVVSLIAYAVAAAKVLLLPLPAALISLFVFYFLSMVIEPLFLRS